MNARANTTYLMAFTKLYFYIKNLRISEMGSQDLVLILFMKFLRLVGSTTGNAGSGSIYSGLA